MVVGGGDDLVQLYQLKTDVLKLCVRVLLTNNNYILDKCYKFLVHNLAADV